MSGKRVVNLIAVLAVVLVATATLTGFFVVQPIGAIPEGTTVWYWRAGLDCPFITSPDGFSLDRTGELSLLSRMSAMTTITEAIEGRIIARLPYMDWMYLRSTDGRRFDR